MNSYHEKRNVFIIGCKGIPAQYGGYETFVEKLTQYQKCKDIRYHVACAVDNIGTVSAEFEHNNAHCYNIKWRKIGCARAVLYDLDAIDWAINYVKINKIKKPVFYILACRIGPFIHYYKNKIKALNGQLYINPDGHEWKRAKWSALIRKYWKLSEQLMVKSADLVICDSKNIERYIKEEYGKYELKTLFIAYGAEIRRSLLNDADERLAAWYTNKNLQAKEYYLTVGRFVPENNYETMIREFMKSNTTKSLALITTVSDKFLKELKNRTKFDKDPRIKFVGTVYEQELLKKIRENAFGYFHGHEVGGTNPSLLESLSSTELNLLLDVEFNREVAADGAIYWNKEEGSLSKLIETTERMRKEEINELGSRAHKRITDCYNWNNIVNDYERIFKLQSSLDRRSRNGRKLAQVTNGRITNDGLDKAYM